MSLKTEYFKTEILGMKRGKKGSAPSNAKPLFFLSIVQALEKGTLLGNYFGYEPLLEQEYLALCSELEPHIEATPFYKPFYHSSTESFYSIKWNSEDFGEHKWHTPSPKFIKEHIQFAYLDPDLWDLLQYFFKKQ